MQFEDISGYARRWRREPLYPLAQGDVMVDDDLPSVTDLLPHRKPFLLVDAVQSVDVVENRLRAKRHIADDDPVFAGHFPGNPVYPGVLQIEMAGQAAICLVSLLHRNEQGGSVTAPVVRATRIHHSVFLQPVLPSDDLEIQVSLLEQDALVCSFAGQVWKRDLLCCLVLGEFYVLE